MMVSATAKRKSRPRRGRRRFVRAVIAALAILLALPFGLTALYRVVDPVSTLMLADRLSGRSYEREVVPLSQIAPVLQHAVVMAEDGRYCAHRGVDWSAVQKVLAEQIGPPRGASTIAMQTVKNLFLWPQRSYLRKVAEVPLAYWADLVLGKRRLLEIYLNLAQFGSGIYGAEAAAEHYFGRSAAGLSAFQAALLAATLPNPTGRDPARPGPRLTAIANLVADRAAQAGAYVGCLAE
jgi:monofunctional biosynthetic peptidoglycan transglycosylase